MSWLRLTVKESSDLELGGFLRNRENEVIVGPCGGGGEGSGRGSVVEGGGGSVASKQHKYNQLYYRSVCV